MNKREKDGFANWNAKQTKNKNIADYKFSQMQEICMENNLTVHCNLEDNLMQLLNILLKNNEILYYKHKEITMYDLLKMYREYIECSTGFNCLIELLNIL